MASECLVRWCLRWGVLAVAAWMPVAAWAGDSTKKLGAADPNHETVDFLSAVQKGQISARLVPRDAWQCRLLLTNKTEKPLNVRLPEAFAGVPVSAQLLPNNNANPSRQNNKNASQALGVTPQMNNFNLNGNNRNPLMNLNAGNRRNQGPLFSIAPEVTGQLKVMSVCLEHGKPGPRSSIPYEIQPIEGVVPKVDVQEVLCMLGQREISLHAAQAAVWHLNNGLSWEKLEAEKTSKLNIPVRPLFSSQELAEAKKAVGQAAKRCKENASAGPTQSAAR